PGVGPQASARSARGRIMSSDLFNLHDETAVVIGGTGTLGGEMAAALAAAGARVAVVGRNVANGEEHVRSTPTGGGRALFPPADALDQVSLLRARDALLKHWGSVTVLVNAAGGNRPEATLKPGDDFCHLPREAWNSVFDLNLVGGALLPSQVFGE